MVWNNYELCFASTIMQNYSKPARNCKEQLAKPLISFVYVVGMKIALNISKDCKRSGKNEDI